MKMIRNRFLIRFLVIRALGVLFLCACTSNLVAQAGIGVSGGHVTSDEISFSYSVGQVFNNTLSNPEYFISQGIQHPMLLVITETSVQTEEIAGMKVYPNPAANQLYIKKQVPDQERSRVLLLNMQGQVLIDKTFDTNEFVLPLETIGTGHYVLKVITEKSETNTFNIIKAK